MASADRRLAEAVEAAERGYFSPQEDEWLRIAFSKYILAREGLHEAIAELRPIAFEKAIPSPLCEQAFLVGCAAAALLVNSATFIVEHVRKSPPLRQKLDEAEPRFGIPRKKYTEIYRSLTSPNNLLALHQSQLFARQRKAELKECATDPILKEVASLLESYPLQYPKFRQSIQSRIKYRFYSLMRRNLSGYQQALFAVFEGSGRIVAELRNPLREKAVTTEVRTEIHKHLQPGDLLVTRHHQAMSNLFLPGFWPHAAFFIGSIDRRRELNVSCSDSCWSRSGDDIEVLEAKKDGVLFRPLAETLQVDYVSIIRPQLSTEQVRIGIERGLTHEGKLYDFTFDFTRADRMVCTEVIYRSLDGVGGITLPLTERAGRLTLSAEDLLLKAIRKDGFEIVGVFGIGEAASHPIFGEQARTLIQESMHGNPVSYQE
ncbi:MAG: YiiX/YebB-like N1pC/P60 family cysteine hydrolase [Pirellulales bacterium]